MSEYKRSQRVAELLREEISNIITKELKDPKIGITTVTHIKLANDLKSARVFVQVSGDQKVRKTSLVRLDGAKNWIRGELGNRLDLKYIPTLTFQYDSSIDYAENIESLLKSIHESDKKE